MDGIQRYAAHPFPAHTQPAPPDPASVKAPSDYLRALRRRFWVVFTIGVPLGVAATVWVLRQPAVYEAEAMVFIEPPQHDPVLAALLSKDVGRRDPEATEKYLPNRVAHLKSKMLAEKVVVQCA